MVRKGRDGRAASIEEKQEIREALWMWTRRTLNLGGRMWTASALCDGRGLQL